MCVRINNSPDTGDYFVANNTLTSNEEIQKLVSDPTKMGFVSTVFKSTSSAVSNNKLTYQLGDKIKSVVTDGTATSPLMQ
jgi:hypothetical protein